MGEIFAWQRAVGGERRKGSANASHSTSQLRAEGEGSQLKRPADGIFRFADTNQNADQEVEHPRRVPWILIDFSFHTADCFGPFIFGISRVIPCCKMHDICNCSTGGARTFHPKSRQGFDDLEARSRGLRVLASRRLREGIEGTCRRLLSPRGKALNPKEENYQIRSLDNITRPYFFTIEFIDKVSIDCMYMRDRSERQGQYREFRVIELHEKRPKLRYYQRLTTPLLNTYYIHMYCNQYNMLKN